MGIELSYWRVSPDTYMTLIQHPERTFARFKDPYRASVYHRDEVDMADATQLSLEKEWQAIHYLLTGDVLDEGDTAAPTLWHKVIDGGAPTPLESGYGHMTYLTPDEVQ